MATAAEWSAKGREQAPVVDLALPSGVTIRARRPGVNQLMAWNMLPASLATGASDEQIESKKIELVSNAELVELARKTLDMLIWCCVDPEVAVRPAAGQIHPREIPETDWKFIVQWAMRAEEVRAFQSFRGQRPDAGSGGDGGDVRPATEQDGGDSGSSSCTRF